METISLRTLLREPVAVKRMARAGQPVQVTDNGIPLWVLQSAGRNEADDAERRRAIDEALDEVLREKPSRFSLSSIVLESR